MLRAYSRANGETVPATSCSRCCAFPASAATRPTPATCGAWPNGWQRTCANLALQNVQVMPTAGHPVVYGEWLGAGPDKPTVLVYGHYDVVPAAMEDGWETPPFEPVVKDGKIYARGATDDKGQLFIHVKALEVVSEDRRRRAGQREVPARRRRRSLVAQPDALSSRSTWICSRPTSA